MEVIHGSSNGSSTRRSSSSSSSLNPNAPMFVPLAYRTVEDFSDEWWSLVHSSPWFRDYWLRERFLDPQFEIDAPFSDFDFDFDFDEDSLFHHQPQNEEITEGKEMISLGALNWGRSRSWAEAPRYAEKAPKIVKPRLSPRAIHQPR